MEVIFSHINLEVITLDRLYCIEMIILARFCCMEVIFSHITL